MSDNPFRHRGPMSAPFGFDPSAPTTPIPGYGLGAVDRDSDPPPTPRRLCPTCAGSGEIVNAFTHAVSSCLACLGSGRDCSDLPRRAPPEPPPHGGVPSEVREAREDGISAIKRQAIREIETGRGPGTALDPHPSDTYERILPNAKGAGELASALALAGLRRLERGLHDVDSRVSFEAARVLASTASKVVELPPPPGSDVADPEARRAALVAALGTPAVIQTILGVLEDRTCPLALALIEAGWHGP